MRYKYCDYAQNDIVSEQLQRSKIEHREIRVSDVWEQCLLDLQDRIDSGSFHTWLRPLQAESEGGKLTLYAPNRFVLDWVKKHYLNDILTLGKQYQKDFTVEVVIGARNKSSTTLANEETSVPKQLDEAKLKDPDFHSNLNPHFTFDLFVEGKSNQLARAASQQVAENPGESYNPLFLYGGVGLGKTHLMHAIGNMILQKKPQAKILYLHSERFVADMVKALQRNQIDAFKRFYRSVDALLIDDIQFFAKKDRSQEEFFHTFNVLLDKRQQIIMTSDRYPKEIDGVEERLKSRFGWGLTIALEPPELETRVAILKSKAEQLDVLLDDEVAFFIAQNIQSNVRELEGGLKRVIAHANLLGVDITVSLAKVALKDILALQAKLVTISNIQQTVADYYKLKVADLNSKRRTRSLTLPRHVAMALAKELTNNSLPEIGEAFGGRDHTTVLHACRKIEKKLKEDTQLAEQWSKLTRILSA